MENNEFQIKHIMHFPPSPTVYVLLRKSIYSNLGSNVIRLVVVLIYCSVNLYFSNIYAMCKLYEPMINFPFPPISFY